MIAVDEGTSSIPEYQVFLKPRGNIDREWFDWRARGIGGTMSIPVSSAGEENAMCWKKKDR